MIKTPIGLPDLRQKIYAKAKAEPTWRFWGLYVHVCKLETLRVAYETAKKNNGAPGIDGVSFEAIEEEGVEAFLEQLRDELLTHRYRPLRYRRQEIPKAGGQGVRVLLIPAIRDRVVQGALKLILEPIFEADFQSGSYGYRPQRNAHEAVYQVAEAIVRGKTHVLDLDLQAFFDNLRHHIVLEKAAQRVKDGDVLHLLKLMLKAGGKKGVAQGGVLSPLLSNLYLNEMDRMLEQVKQDTRRGNYTALEYVRYADDLVILVDAHPRHEGLVQAVDKGVREELAKVQVEVNEAKSRTVDLAKGEGFGFLGFEFRRVRTRSGKWRPHYTPQPKKRTRLVRKLKAVFRRFVSQPVEWVIEEINPILRGWVNYFAVGHASRCFGYIRDWVEKRVRRHLMRARNRPGFGWKRWSRQWLYERLGLYKEYGLKRYQPRLKALPVR